MKLVVHNLNEDSHGSLNVADNFHTNQGYTVTKADTNTYRQQEVTLTHVNPSKTPIGHQPNTINNSPRLDISSPPLVPAIAGTTTQCQLPDGHGTYTCISFENIHPIRPDIKRFNSTQFYTSSMIDLSSYNNPTQSSQAKVTTSFALNNSQNDKRPGTAPKTYPETKKNVLMQIEHVPRLRIPAWRSIS